MELILPINQLSDEVIILKIKKLKINNKFLRLFEINELKLLEIQQFGDGNILLHIN